MCHIKENSVSGFYTRPYKKRLSLSIKAVLIITFLVTLVLSLRSYFSDYYDGNTSSQGSKVNSKETNDHSQNSSPDNKNQISKVSNTTSKSDNNKSDEQTANDSTVNSNQRDILRPESEIRKYDDSLSPDKNNINPNSPTLTEVRKNTQNYITYFQSISNPEQDSKVKPQKTYPIKRNKPVHNIYIAPNEMKSNYNKTSKKNKNYVTNNDYYEKKSYSQIENKKSKQNEQLRQIMISEEARTRNSNNKKKNHLENN